MVPRGTSNAAVPRGTSQMLRRSIRRLGAAGYAVKLGGERLMHPAPAHLKGLGQARAKLSEQLVVR